MDIGTKIKEARNVANLTQEEAAEQLFVSRQTISNWENGKTYPDIMSVVRMSEVYHMSLDQLLKSEETENTKFLSYLSESTNIVKSKNKIYGVVLLFAYLFIWILSTSLFVFLSSKSINTAYNIGLFAICIPLTIFIISLLIGKNQFWGKGKWLSSIAFGFSYMVTDLFTMASYGILSPHLNYSYYLFLPIGILISLFGLETGTLLHSLLEKRKTKTKPKTIVSTKSFELNLLFLFLPLLPLLILFIFACINLHLISSHNWSVRFFTIALFILYGWAMAIQLPYILYFFIKKKSANFKKDFPVLCSELCSFVVLILLIVEYKIFDKWYQTSSNGTLPYPFYGASYTLNILVLCLLFLNFILAGIFIIKRIKKISLSN